MKKKMTIAISLLAIVAIIAGGTFAWFTATTEPVTNEFTAGTVDIELIDKFDGAPKVNPGDCYEKEVYVKSTGNKKTLVRIKKDIAFENELNLGVVNYELWENWVLKEDGYFYYTKVLIENEETTPLFAENKICFDGAEMGNEYQGAKLNIVVKAEAIQATNNAPTDQSWLVDPLYEAPEAD